MYVIPAGLVKVVFVVPCLSSCLIFLSVYLNLILCICANEFWCILFDPWVPLKNSVCTDGVSPGKEDLIIIIPCWIQTSRFWKSFCTYIWHIWLSTAHHISFLLKGIFSDFNNNFLWHESEDLNQKCLFPKFHLIPILRFQVTHDYVYFILP